MTTTSDPLPDDTDALKAALIEARAKLSGAEALIEHLQLLIAKMKRELFGPRSERSQRLLDQLELQLEELMAAAAEDDAKAQAARIEVQGFGRAKTTRRDFPAHLPRRRIVHPAPTSCPCCGSTKLSKVGEDVTETLDVVPRQLFVTQHVREDRLAVRRKEIAPLVNELIEWMKRERAARRLTRAAASRRLIFSPAGKIVATAGGAGWPLPGFACRSQG